MHEQLELINNLTDLSILDIDYDICIAEQYIKSTEIQVPSLGYMLLTYMQNNSISIFKQSNNNLLEINKNVILEQLDTLLVNKTSSYISLMKRYIDILIKMIRIQIEDYGIATVHEVCFKDSQYLEEVIRIAISEKEDIFRQICKIKCIHQKQSKTIEKITDMALSTTDSHIRQKKYYELYERNILQKEKNRITKILKLLNIHYNTKISYKNVSKFKIDEALLVYVASEEEDLFNMIMKYADYVNESLLNRAFTYYQSIRNRYYIPKNIKILLRNTQLIEQKDIYASLLDVEDELFKIHDNLITTELSDTKTHNLQAGLSITQNLLEGTGGLTEWTTHATDIHHIQC